MPERKCVGCKRQEEWGCEAYRIPVEKNTRDALLDRNGDWWLWVKPATLPMTVDGEEFYACPRQDLMKRGRVWNTILFYYGFYKKGYLPQAGGLEDQSNYAMEIFRILDDVNAECDQAEVERRAAGEERNRQFGARQDGRRG